MTSLTGSGASTDQRAASSPRERYHGLSRVISTRVLSLQTASSKKSSNAVARLARLRRAITTAPGAEPEVWDDTIGLVPENELGHGDDPSVVEIATHVSMTLFALHRQGKCSLAHQAGFSLGRAVRTLSRRRAGGDGESEGVRRRFDAVLTAISTEETAYHLRGLVLLLRDELIPLDYGQLVVDLADLWTPTRGDVVRLRWARDYRRTPNGSDGPDTTIDSGMYDEENQS